MPRARWFAHRQQARESNSSAASARSRAPSGVDSLAAGTRGAARVGRRRSGCGHGDLVAAHRCVVRGSSKPGAHRDELSADRYHVVLADRDAAGGPGTVIESAARAAEAGTALVLFGDPDTARPSSASCGAAVAAPRSGGRRSSTTIRSECRRRSRGERWIVARHRAGALDSVSSRRRIRRRRNVPKLTSVRAPARPRCHRPSSPSTWASRRGPAWRDRRPRWRPSVGSHCASRNGRGRGSPPPASELVPASRPRTDRRRWRRPSPWPKPWRCSGATDGCGRS